MVLRVIPTRDQDHRRAPPAAGPQQIAEEERGLVLVTGTTGSGKSTTLAAMIDHINSTRSAHIMTVEDPIEYLHRDYQSIVNQREVAVDTRRSRTRCAARCARIPTSSSSARCATSRRSRPRCSPPRPGTWCSRRCTRSTPRRRSTASSRCFRRTSSGRSGSSSSTVLQGGHLAAPDAARRRPRPRRRRSK